MQTWDAHVAVRAKTLLALGARFANALSQTVSTGDLCSRLLGAMHCQKATTLFDFAVPPAQLSSKQNRENPEKSVADADSIH